MKILIQSSSCVSYPLKTLKGSRIGRSTKYGVGKEIRGEIYVHKNYVLDVVPPDIFEVATKLLKQYYPEFKYNCIKYNPKTHRISFQEVPDFDTAREPVVGDYVIVDTESQKCKFGHSNYIFHHKWLWVKDDYSGFDVFESWCWSKKWLAVLTEPSDGNGIQRWNAQLTRFGLQ